MKSEKWKKRRRISSLILKILGSCYQLLYSTYHFQNEWISCFSFQKRIFISFHFFYRSIKSWEKKSIAIDWEIEQVRKPKKSSKYHCKQFIIPLPYNHYMNCPFGKMNVPDVYFIFLFCFTPGLLPESPPSLFVHKDFIQ